MSLLDFLTKEEKLAVQTYLRYGKSSITDCTSEDLIESLVDKQYEGFKCVEKIENVAEYK